MGYVFTPLWAALQISFAILFLSSFLEVKRRKDEMVWIAVVAWLVTAIYGLFEVQGIHGYLMYLLATVLILLAIHGEYGPKGLCLLVLVFLIPVVIDLAVLYLTADLSGLTHYLAVTGGKVLSVVLVLVLRRFKVLSTGKQTQPDGDMLLLRQHMEMQQESMAALEQNYRIQRKNAHEFEHHMQVLRDLLDRGEVSAARDYLDRLKKNRSIHVMSVSSNHPVIDVILNQKYQTARENEIKMQIQVNDLSALTIPTDSLVVVLTNLLDNAIEASGECFFIVKDGVIITPPNDTSLESITQKNVIQIAKDLGYTVLRQRITRDEAYNADEAFFTGTAAEVTPISSIDSRVIGSGKRGPVSHELQGAYFDIVMGKNPKYEHLLTYIN